MPQTKTDEAYRQELSAKNATVESLDPYINNHTKLRTLCKLCGHIWEALPINLLHGCGCPVCAVRRITKPASVFLKELQEHNPNIEPLEAYKNDRTKIKVRCKVCSHVWFAYPTHMIRGTGCPVCAQYSMEAPVIKALKKKGIEYLYNTQLIGSNYNGSNKPLTVDFIIETTKGRLAIETDGKQHFRAWHSHNGKDLKHIQEKDRYKDKILKERGYILIRVTSSPTKEWGYKNHITLTELLSLLDSGIDSTTKEIDFELFSQYDFNRS